MAKREIEVLVRGVIVLRGNVVVCRTKGDSNTYLPGGHLEFGERAVEALQREVLEEMGLRLKVKGFLGAAEHTFVQRGEKHCEINLVFRMSGRGLSPERAPASREHWIEFAWVPLAKLASAKLEPAPLRKLLPVWLKATGRECWGSSYASERR